MARTCHSYDKFAFTHRAAFMLCGSHGCARSRNHVPIRACCHQRSNADASTTSATSCWSLPISRSDSIGTSPSRVDSDSYVPWAAPGARDSSTFRTSQQPQRAPARQRGSSPLSCRHCRLKVVAHQPAMLTRAALHKTGDTPLADLQSLGWFVHVFRRSGGDPQSKPFVASGCEEISRRTAGCSRPTAGPATGSVQGRPTSTTGCRCRRSVQALSRGYPRLRGPRRRG